MGIIKGTYSRIKPVSRWREWVGVDEHKRMVGTIVNLVKSLIRIPEPKRKESFKQAVKRFHLSEKDIKQRTKQFTFLSILFYGLAICSFSWMLYLATHKLFAGCILSMAVTGILVMFAFRYHFWLFQIKHRKLGCSVKEWFNSSIKG